MGQVLQFPTRPRKEASCFQEVVLFFCGCGDISDIKTSVLHLAVVEICMILEPSENKFFLGAMGFVTVVSFRRLILSVRKIRQEQDRRYRLDWQR